MTIFWRECVCNTFADHTDRVQGNPDWVPQPNQWIKLQAKSLCCIKWIPEWHTKRYFYYLYMILTLEATSKCLLVGYFFPQAKIRRAPWILLNMPWRWYSTNWELCILTTLGSNVQFMFQDLALHQSNSCWTSVASLHLSTFSWENRLVTLSANTAKR